MTRKPSRIITLLARHQLRYFPTAGAHTEVVVKGEESMNQDVVGTATEKQPQPVHHPVDPSHKPHDPNKPSEHPDKEHEHEHEEEKEPSK